jgi:PPOX class probable F420-dependent enzyme
MVAALSASSMSRLSTSAAVTGCGRPRRAPEPARRVEIQDHPRVGRAGEHRRSGPGADDLRRERRAVVGEPARAGSGLDGGAEQHAIARAGGGIERVLHPGAGRRERVGGRAARRGSILLTSYKRDGTPVGTPVSIPFDGDRVFFRSYDKAWKTKRLRNNPQVDVAPSTLRGEPTGPAIQVRASLLVGAQAGIAAKALARRHRVLHSVVVPLAHRLVRYETMHYELHRPTSGPNP